MADEKTVKVTISADPGPYERGVQRTKQATQSLIGSFADYSRQAEVSVGKVGKSMEANAAAAERTAQRQREAWASIGGPIAAAGAAMVAVTAAVTRTGIAYNSLQQTSRAALTTMLGSAQAVNQQMDKLDAFAKTSPFSKATFISAQQQMLAFGIEASKVVPYLDAINEAVAAAGGNSQQVAEISFIMAQISSASKITAQDLMQFGQRGVNAAELIGSQMGMTAAEIRDSITAGTLDADAALDALAAGMKERFDGASENVKNTMGGAFDRLSAAWRDFSAGMMEPFVGSEGGGLLVELTNTAADLLRMLDDLPPAAKFAAGAIGSVGGAAALAVGSFLLLIPRINETITAWKALQLTSKLGGIMRIAAPAGIALGALALIIGNLAKQHAEAAEAADAYQQALSQEGAAAEKSVRETAARALAAKGVADAMRDLGLAEATATDAALGNAEARQQIIDAYERELQAKADIVSAAAEQTGLAYAEAEELAASVSARDQVIAAIDGQAEALGRGKEQLADEAALMEETAESTNEATGAMQGFGGALEEVETKAVNFSEGTRQLEESFADWVEMVSGSYGEFVNLGGAYDELVQKGIDLARETASATGDAEDSWEDYYDGVSVTLTDLISLLEEQVAAQANWADNITALAGRASQGMLDYLIELGPEYAGLVQELVNGTDAQLSELEELWRQSGEIAGNDFAGGLDAQLSVIYAVGAKMGDAAMESAAEKIRSGEATLADIIAEYDLVATIDADGNPALEEANRVAALIRSMRIVIPATVGVQGGIPTVNSTRGGGFQIQGRASGGPIYGPGTATSDSIPIMASNGEYMIRTYAAQRIGRADLDYINATGQLPPRQYRADGGPIGSSTGYFTTNNSSRSSVYNDNRQYHLEGREAMSFLIANTRDADLNRYAERGNR